MYLLDTNIISEMRKVNTKYRSDSFSQWFEQIDLNLCYLSAMSLFEVEMGILRKERQDKQQGEILRRWFEDILKPEFDQRILPVSPQIALETAKFHIPNPASMIDSFIGATAKQHNKVLVTRNVKDFESFGIGILNPFG